MGILYLRLHLPEARSLKDKRQVVSSLLGRLRSRFGVTVAEVADQDVWQTAGLAVATVSAQGSVCLDLLGAVARYVEESGPYVVLEMTREVR